MKNKRKLSANNGVSLSYRVEVNERIKIPFFNDIMLALLAMMTTVGAIMTFATMLQLRVVPWVLMTWIAGFTAVYAVAYTLIKKWRALVMAGVALIVGVIVLLFFDDVVKGTVILFDQAKLAIYNAMYWTPEAATYTWHDSFLTLTHLVMVLLSAVLCAAVTYFTVVKASFIAIFLLTFPFFEVGAAFGAVPNYTYFAMMLASWAASLAIVGVANAKIKMRRSNGKKQKQSISGNRQKFAGIAVVIAMVVVLLFTTVNACLNAIGFSRAGSLDLLRREIKFTYEDIVDYLSGVDHDGSLKEGKLYEVSDRIIKQRHYMTMDTNVSYVEYPISLKGYTGAVYRDNRWSAVSNYAQYEDMFERFNNAAYQMGLNAGELLKNTPHVRTLFLADITLSDFRRKKPYMYEVYFADLSAFETSYDAYAVPDKKSAYSYGAYLSSQYVYDIPESLLYQDPEYKAAFAEYAAFVQQAYTNSQVTGRVKDLAMSFEAGDQYAYVSVVRKYLKDTTEHTMKTGKCPDDKDFVEYFLFDSKKGYSTHYATAATVLLQAKGYAARYVEGYYIPADVFNEAPSKHELGFKSIDITDEYAHAWVEIFDETYGWIPVEVTPEYWDDDEIERPTSKPQEDTTPPPQEPDEPQDDYNSDTPVTSEPDASIGVDSVIVDEDVENEVDAPPPTEAKPFPWWIVLVCAAGAVVIAVCAVRLAMYGNKRRAFASHNVNRKMKFAYKYVVKLAAYRKVKIGNVCHYMALAEQLDALNADVQSDVFVRVFRVMLKHAYAPQPATLSEADEVLRLLREYSHAMYATLPMHKKWAYRLWWNLY